MPQSHPGAEAIGDHTNPEKYRGKHHWDFPCQVSACASGVGGQQNLTPPVSAGYQRRIRELTIRNAMPNDTVVSLVVSGGCTRLSLDVPTQTTRQWSSQDGRLFNAGEVPGLQTSVSGSHPNCVFITGAGLEEPVDPDCPVYPTGE